MSSAVPFPTEDPAFISAPISDGKVDERQNLASTRISELVQAARGGDREAFGELYRLHHAPLYRMARFHVGQDAEDAVAEVFVRAWGALGRYQQNSRPFVSWLYGIARHVVVDELRRRRLRPIAEIRDAADRSPDPNDRLLIVAALERLPDDQRRVIEMKFLLGLRNREVAAATGRSVGAVNALQWRALQALRDRLGER